MKKWIKLGCGIAVLAVVSACTQANTAGPETTKELTNEFVNRGSGPFIVYSPVTVNYTSADQTDIETDNDPTQTTKGSAGLNGGTGTLADEGAGLLLDGVTSLMDNSMKDASKKITQPAPPTVQARGDAGIVTPVETEPTTVEPITGNVKETFDVRDIGGGKMHVWFPQTGSYYGGPMKLTLNGGCGGIDIKDASESQGTDGTKNYGQNYYFSGTDFPVGSAENDGGVASIVSKPGCSATSVTIEYTK